MGLFDFFKKKEVVANIPNEQTKEDEPTKQVDVPIQETKKDEPIKNIEIPVEEKKETAPERIENTERSKLIITTNAKEIIKSDEIITETVYEFSGINYDFIDKLYFVNEEQKSKVLKFVNALIVKFKFNEIKTQKDYFKFEDSSSKYYDFVDNYKDVYTDENGLQFPYFGYTDYVSWKITDIYFFKDDDGVVKENSRIDCSHETTLTITMCYFNVRNKTTNNFNDIELEEQFSNDYNIKNKTIDGAFILDALIPYYFKAGNLSKVLDLFHKAVDAVEVENRPILESYFSKLSDLYIQINQHHQAIEFLLKGITEIKNNFPTPKSKTMGSIYKTLVQLLFEQKEYQKALLTINEAIAYNANLSFKQIQAKIEKELAK
jgi:tetratricopeptide (TPR) repeat protein